MTAGSIPRKKTRAARVGELIIGAGAPIIIQSMTNIKVTDTDATIDQVNQLAETGCELVRVAVPDRASAAALEKIVVRSPVPIVADIHFDLELAFRSMESGAKKIRVNPGNLGGRDKLVKLANRAKSFGVALRVGVNSGSLEKKILNSYGAPSAEALVQSALGYLTTLEEEEFDNLVVSLKASDVYTTIKACRLFSTKSDYPLHLGVTEAGPLQSGTIKGAIGIGTLLAEGIGDTLRVSLTAAPVEEVKVARQILQALNIRKFGPELISCPTCGRCEVDLMPLVNEVSAILEDYSLPVKIAVMGCAVNGPGEAREADLGVSAGKKQGIIFRNGQVIKTVKSENLLETFKKELEKTLTINSSSPGGE